jgi:hypothetical protein
MNSINQIEKEDYNQSGYITNRVQNSSTNDSPSTLRSDSSRTNSDRGLI